MTRSRVVVLSSFAVAGLALVAALGAFYLDPARAAVGPLPAAALVLPADTAFVAGLDVQRFTASPFYRRFAKESQAARPKALAELEERTGINPERDVDQVVLAGRRGEGKDPLGLAIVLGRFDQYKLGRYIETRGKGVSWKNDDGVLTYLFAEGTKDAAAVAFLDDRTLVLGPQSVVEATLAAHSARAQGLRANTALVALLEKVRPGSTFWLVGDETLLAHLPKVLPGAGGGGTSVTLPALESLTITGDLDPLLSLDVTGGAADEASARNLADVVRGFVALATLQASQKPELRQLASAISVTTEARDVRVTARLPYELFDALQPRKPPAPVAPAPPTAPEPPAPPSR